MLILIESSNVRITRATNASSDILKPLWFTAFAMHAPNHCHISHRFTRQTIHTKFQMSNKISNQISESLSEYVFACVFVSPHSRKNLTRQITIWKTNQSQSRNRNIFCIIATINTSHNFFHPTHIVQLGNNGKRVLVGVHQQ